MKKWNRVFRVKCGCAYSLHTTERGVKSFISEWDFLTWEVILVSDFFFRVIREKEKVGCVAYAPLTMDKYLREDGIYMAPGELCEPKISLKKKPLAKKKVTPRKKSPTRKKSYPVYRLDRRDDYSLHSSLKRCEDHNINGTPELILVNFAYYEAIKKDEKAGFIYSAGIGMGKFKKGNVFCLPSPRKKSPSKKKPPSPRGVNRKPDLFRVSLTISRKAADKALKRYIGSGDYVGLVKWMLAELKAEEVKEENGESK